MAQITRKKKGERVLKVILIGDPGVGKSSLINTYVHGRFKHSYQVTIGLDVSSKIIELTGQAGYSAGAPPEIFWKKRDY